MCDYCWFYVMIHQRVSSFAPFWPIYCLKLRIEHSQCWCNHVARGESGDIDLSRSFSCFHISSMKMMMGLMGLKWEIIIYLFCFFYFMDEALSFFTCLSILKVSQECMEYRRKIQVWWKMQSGEGRVILSFFVSVALGHVCSIQRAFLSSCRKGSF